MGKKDFRTGIWTLILVLIPIISFLLNYYFSIQSNTLQQFKGNYALYYLDWLFLPFNLLILYAFKLDKKKLMIFTISSFIIIGFLNAMYWQFSRNVGYIHGIFASIELGLLLTIVFSEWKIKKYAIISLIPILIYFLLGLVVLLFIYKYSMLNLIESILFIIGMIAIITKIVIISKNNNKRKFSD